METQDKFAKFIYFTEMDFGMVLACKR